ncbi:MAG: hypothetical protein HYZ85_02840 [Candidatus Omnitrophica bacterium]|nr:hypothetical protein [Candidatus Omnitrophota bacterium]
MEVKDKFLTLRAQNLSYAKIAEQLGVSKQTLIAWSKSLRVEIGNLRAIHLEELQEKYHVLRAGRLELFGQQLHTVTEELKKRTYADVPTDKLVEMFIKFAQILKQDDSGLLFIEEKMNNETDIEDLTMDMSQKRKWEA